MNMQLLPSILEMISGSTSENISQKLGLTPTQVTTATTIALPLLLQALSKNAQDPEGVESLAGALKKDHDGSLLENVGSFIQKSNFQEGDSILKHLIGSGRSDIASTIGSMAGIDSEKSMQILSLLAPIVMGFIGQYMTKQNLSPQDLASNLAKEEKEVQSSAPDASSIFKKLIDSNGDGEISDDVMKIGGQLLGAFLKNK
jgi:hypothetical protein